MPRDNTRIQADKLKPNHFLMFEPDEGNQIIESFKTLGQTL